MKNCFPFIFDIIEIRNILRIGVKATHKAHNLETVMRSPGPSPGSATKLRKLTATINNRF